MPRLVPGTHEAFGIEGTTLREKKRAALEFQAAHGERPRFTSELRRSNSKPDRSSAKNRGQSKPELRVISAVGYYRSNFRRAEPRKLFDLEFA